MLTKRQRWPLGFFMRTLEIAVANGRIEFGFDGVVFTLAVRGCYPDLTDQLRSHLKIARAVWLSNGTCKLQLCEKNK